MKEGLNIDKLFKQKFESFEGNVDPSAWANISSSIGAGATGGATGATAVGLSSFAKVAIIVGAAAVTTFSAWYFTNDSDNEIVNDNPIVVSNDDPIVNDDNAIAVEDNDFVEENNNNNENGGLVENNEQPDDNNVNERNDLSGNQVDRSNDGENTNDSNNEGNHDNDDNQEDPGDQDEDTSTDPNEPDDIVKLDNTVPIKASPEWFIVDGNEVSFNANAENHDRIIWKLGDGNAVEGDEITHEYKSAGKKKVTVVISTFDGKKKEYNLVVEIEGTSGISVIPNVFTPTGGDNTNDYYSVTTNGIEHFNINIQDRSGKLVFTSKDPNFEWNGERMDGTGKVAPGKYYVKVDAAGEDGVPHQRFVTLTIQ